MKNVVSVLFLFLITNLSYAQTHLLSGGTVLTEHDVITGLEVPWEILWGTDNHIWCTERKGKISRINPETGNKQDLINLDPQVAGGISESGMLGMALHPNFPATPRVFVAYIYFQGYSAELGMRIISLEYNGTALVNPQTLLEDIPANDMSVGGRMLITEEEKLLVTVGDMNMVGSSLEPTGHLGKVLRLNLDGSIPADNPDPSSYVFTLGHKNPQGLANGPQGSIFCSEIGSYTDDEINELIGGANYGYPIVSGDCNTDSEIFYCEANNVREPLGFWLPNMGLNGMSFYNHPAIPEFSNSLLIGGVGNPTNEYRGLYKFKLSEDLHSIINVESLLTSYGMIRDVCINPHTGSIYVATNGFSHPGMQPNRIIELSNESYIPESAPGSGHQDPFIHTDHLLHPNYVLPGSEIIILGGNTIKGIKKNAQINPDTDVYPQKKGAEYTAHQYMICYPNPTDNILYLSFSPSFIGESYQIFSYQGRLLLQTDITDVEMTLDISKLPAGNYYIKASNKLGTISKTIQVAH